MTTLPVIAPVVEDLPNGADFICTPSQENDIATVLVFHGYSHGTDPTSRPGLNHFTAGMLKRGTKHRTSFQFANAVDCLGVQLGHYSDNDYGVSYLRAPKDKLAKGLDLLRESLLEPLLSESEMEKEQARTLSMLRQEKDNRMLLAFREAATILFPEHGYGLNPLGTEESIKALTIQDIRNQVLENSNPLDFTVVALGNVDPDVVRSWGGELQAANSRVRCQRVGFTTRYDDSDENRIRHIEQDTEQSNYVLSFRTCSRCDVDHYILRVMSGVLGESMSSRLFVNLRDKLGLAYATGSSLNSKMVAGYFTCYIGTKPERLEEAKQAMWNEIVRIREELVPEDELERTKRYLIGRFLVNQQTGYERGMVLGNCARLGLGTIEASLIEEKLNAVTAEQIRTAASLYLANPPAMVTVGPTVK